jgi:hypothetical protein
MAIYRIRQHGEADIFVKAKTVSVESGGVFSSRTQLRFEGEDGEAAFFTVHFNFSVAPEHMLFTSFGDDMLLAGGDRTPNDGFDFLTDTLVTEADKRPFSPEERRTIVSLLDDSKRSIQHEFNPSADQQREIDEKLDYLAHKVSVLSKFDWKRLFVASLVGISVDLCFGTTIPVALIALFRQILVTLAERLPIKRLGTSEPKRGG